MDNYKLTYSREKSQEIRIETITSKTIAGGTSSSEHQEPLYFEQEYKEALKMINDIIELQKKEHEDKKNGCNNRILFIGQRGCGKTSVMRSLADYLVGDNVNLLKSDGTSESIKFLFDCLPMVDPSHFDNNNNILLTVITSMFSVTKKKMLEVRDNEDVSGRREELLKQFDNVFKSLESIKSELQTYTLETLNRKSGAEDMRGKMNKLVQNYLELLNGIRGSDPKYSKLVLMIDDIDMSVSYASEMLEQLRKYLELDNLIILMSANLNQLYNEMREHYSKAFQNTLNTLNDQNQALSIDVEDLASKYLLKLFPTSRRVNVERHVSQLLKTRLILEDCGKDDELQKVILSLIWEKTRLLFVPKDPDTILHPIIPTNLRDLAQFLDMLTVLPEVSHENNKLFGDEEAYDTCNKNLQVFKQYVMKTWIPSHLSVEEELVFENIPSDITEINKHLINSINVIGTKHKDRLMSREVSLDMIERNAENVNIDRDIYTMVSPNDPRFVKANKISDIFNQPSNYSYGDLLLMIDKYETYFESEDDRKFTDAIKIYYTILLFETMFFMSNNVIYDYKAFVEDKDKEKDMVIPIQKLIGGTVYYPNYFEIITEKHFNQKGPSFDAKRAFYHKVEVKDKEDVGKGYPFFAVLYYGDIRPDRYDKKHIYDTTYENDADVDGKKYVTFDMLSILNNMLNPCHTLGRFYLFEHKEEGREDGSKDEKMGEILREWNDYHQEWAETNRIAEKSIPNAILPFYAVDLMLNYLGHSYTANSIIKEEYNRVIKEVESIEELLKSYCVFYTTSDSIGNSESTDGQSNVGSGQNEGTDLIPNLIKVLNPNSLFNTSPDQVNTQSKDEGQKDGKEPKHLLETYFDVIKYAFGFVKKSITDEDDVIVERFRDKMIFKVLALKAMPKRERDSLIKDLHKCKSVAEIYKLLVDVLWKDAIMENLIRFRIQEEIRKKASVENYYNKLWKKTKALLESEGIIVDIYQDIFDKAKKVFVYNSETSMEL